jgi:hypothetical protein
MKHGHVKGTRTVSWKQQQWYKQIEEENIRRIEAAQAAKQQG